ncbi:hypothetical protein [Chitinophaga arvensicola]|uniref:Uncharacterized protein n=1 Tax=Chitinophaga arvensicola TaxID=29529 RepID=A0A1I0QLP9_9BACT|nr:hypothetical protein [Chitinophaga arvensicola]SEW28099.1 hypothetical protein SAMN04488122_1555 [Chitinophaga arvensicola]
MRSFYIADGVIQGILGLSCIAGTLSYPLHLPVFFPVIYSFYALAGWQLFSAFLQVGQYKKIRYNSWLHILHLGFLGVSASIAAMLLLANVCNIRMNGVWSDLYGTVVYVDLLIALPLMMLLVSIFSFRRLFITAALISGFFLPLSFNTY